MHHSHIYRSSEADRHADSKVKNQSILCIIWDFDGVSPVTSARAESAF
jgi:hypothetical protein